MKLVLTGEMNELDIELQDVVTEAVGQYLDKMKEEQPEQFKFFQDNLEAAYFTEVAVTFGFKLKGQEELQVLTVAPHGEDMPELLVVECPVRPDGTVITEDISDNEEQSLFTEEQAELVKLGSDISKLDLSKMETVDRKYSEEQYKLVTDINIGNQATVNIYTVISEPHIVSVQYCYAEDLQSYYQVKQEVLIDLSTEENSGKSVADVVSHYEKLFKQ